MGGMCPPVHDRLNSISLNYDLTRVPSAVWSIWNTSAVDDSLVIHQEGFCSASGQGERVSKTHR